VTSQTYDYRGAVKAFHEAMGVECAPKPTVADEATRVLRCRLLLEEVLEFIKASGCCVWSGPRSKDAPFGLTVESTVGRMGEQQPNLAQMAHELADIHYVTFGADLAFGFPSERVFAEVHAANMRKAGPDGKVLRRADGKITKPVGWRPADVAKVLQAHVDGLPPGSKVFRRDKTGKAASWRPPVDRSGPNCHHDSDGDCGWKECPQSRDGEPERSGRSCPLPGLGDFEDD
jgi:predicted HAD superfamily Cof-like phosphohydrolase